MLVYAQIHIRITLKSYTMDTSHHNIRFEELVTEDIRVRNMDLLHLYREFVDLIRYVQGFLDEEPLRARFESNMLLNPDAKATIEQCATNWCMVSVGCDDEGCYTVVYSLDYRIQDLLGHQLANFFVRKIYDQLWDKALYDYVFFATLSEESDKVFKAILLESQHVEFHELYCEPMHEV